jgi:exodeoxyribonuclease VII large subunit
MSRGGITHEHGNHAGDYAGGLLGAVGLRYLLGGSADFVYVGVRRLFTLTVGQLNRYIKSLLEGDGKLSDLYIKGEISNFTHHYRSGHFYFTLKDEKSAVRAVMFQSHAAALPFLPENGMALLVRASVGLYERDGQYQLYVTDMQPDGTGALAVAYEQLRRRLSDEGLFDESRKKTLPRFPRVIGVVTSQTGAAIQDILNILSRRWPLAKVLVYPATVQGAGAAKTLLRGVKTLDGKADVIILGRGGGSAEDLWPFNDEMLARTIAAAATPIVSAVGHETDYTICDFVADLRAPTPSAAAELVAPSLTDYQRRVTAYGVWLRRNAREMLDQHALALDRITSRPAFQIPMEQVRKKQRKLDFFAGMLYNNKKILLERLAGELARRAALLDSLSPLRVLERGYAAVFSQAGAIQAAADVKAGDRLHIRFRDGEVEAQVNS